MAAKSHEFEVVLLPEEGEGRPLPLPAQIERITVAA